MMKKQLLLSGLRVAIVLVLLLPGAISGHAQTNSDVLSAEDYVPGEVLVKFRPGVTPVALDGGVEMGVASLDSLVQEYGITAAEPLFPRVVGSTQGLERIYKLDLPPTADVLAVVEALSADSYVEYAEPNYIYSIQETPEEEIPPTPETPLNAPELSDLLAKAQANGQVRVIVGLRVPFKPEDELVRAQAVDAQRARIAQAQRDLLAQLSAHNVTNVKTSKLFPYMAMTVDVAALQYLASSPDVTSIEEDKLVFPTLAESVRLVGATTAWNQGDTGAGWTVAVLDTGVDNDHPFLSGKVVSEACYSTNDWGIAPDGSIYIATSVCPGQVISSTLPESGENCDLGIAGCDHGTHVAGIVAGYQSDKFAGVAREAQIIAIQVFSRMDSAFYCRNRNPCAMSFDFDQFKGLERVYELRNTFNIAAVNMSLGGGQYYNQNDCDSAYSSSKGVIDRLRSVGIATVVSSGNDGYTDSMNAPACISSAISVGSTNDGSWFSKRDAVSSFTNSAPFLTFLAPGRWIMSSVPGGRYATWEGTSQAAPHVAGAWAILRQKAPLASVSQVADALISIGVPVTDTRDGANNRVKPRIQVDAALNVLNGKLTVSNEPVYNFGVHPVGSTTTKVFTVTNRGSFTATSMSGGGLTTPFAFAGEAYPGAGGTCGFSLNPGESCTVVVTFSPSQNIPFMSTLTISYTANNLAGTFSSNLTLTGTGGGEALFPNDSLFTDQWGLHNTGQEGGKEDADIDAPEAWGIITGTTGVMVAVIDTGVDYNHEDLDDGRVRTDIDKDYVNNDNDAMDDHSHGTHVAGIIAAETNNGIGVAGIMWQAKILPLKVCSKKGLCQSDHIASAIRYAADQGAQVINMSLGDRKCSQTIADAVNYAHFDKGVVLVAAAGNDGDSLLSYPAKHDAIIAVGATDRNDKRAGFSNYGKELDVVAPGVSIYSTVLNNGYDRMSGTSMASPHVAGVAGLLLSQRPTLTNNQVRDILRQSADDLGKSGFDDLYGYGRVNAYRALQATAPSNPVAPERAKCPVCGSTAVAENQPDELSLLSNLRSLRDQVFTQDPGKRWSQIYYEHKLEVAWLVMSDSQLRGDVLAGWRAFDPVFTALLDGTSPPVTLTPERIAAAELVFMGVAQRGSPTVREVILREWNKVNPNRFVGWDVRQVWKQLRAEESGNNIYLPLITR
ncbi:MAG: S8 family serine peptidase [Anaerolineae bacterium]|nr:S8 family serine peptidase [Anaerolineae bacterium]